MNLIPEPMKIILIEWNDDETGKPYTEVHLLLKANDQYYSTINPDELVEYQGKGRSVRILYVDGTSSTDPGVFNVEWNYMMALAEVYPAKYVRYDYSWEYGGPEEGGWYYGMADNPTVITKEEYDQIEEENRHNYNHNRSYVVYEEFLPGENIKTDTQHYC